MSVHSDTSIDDSSDRSLSSLVQAGSSGAGGNHPQLQLSTSSSFPQYSNIIGQPFCGTSCPPPIIICPHNNSSEHKEYINEEFIRSFNDRYGDQHKILQAKRLMKKMRILGGLHPSSNPDNIDIPSARMGFALLAALNNHDLKMEALNHLEYLLENDPVTEASSIQLVSLTIKVMNQLDREIMQTEILEVQIKTAKIYGLLAELLQRQMGKKHINAITDDLRTQLLNTARALRDLNRLEDPRLDFFVTSALEGIKRVLDDHKGLYEIAGRLYNAAMLGVSFYFRDLNNAPAYTENTFGGIDIKYKFSWYDLALTALALGRKAMTDERALAALQHFTFQHASKNNWRFVYLVVDILTNIAINSPSEQIRKTAFQGKPKFEEFPGVLAFKGYDKLGKEFKIKPVVFLNRPKFINHDGTIRLATAKALIRISEECPDLAIRKRARTEFLARYQKETSIGPREYESQIFEKIQGKELAWINEEPPFDTFPIKKKEWDTSSLTPRRYVSISTLFHQAIIPNEPQEPTCSSSEIPKKKPERKESRIEDLVAAAEMCRAKGLLSEAHSILSSAIKKGLAKNVDKAYLSALYEKRGEISIEQQDPQSAEHDLLKAIEHNADNSDAMDLLKQIR